MFADDKIRVFLSYSHVDRDYADMFEEKVHKSNYKEIISITRDIRSAKYRDSFNDFMNTIAEHDVVVAIISDAYLKSASCLYEATSTTNDVIGIKGR